MLWRKKKSDEGYEEKSKASGILKVSVVIFILVFVLLLIPEEWFEKKVADIEEGKSASEVKQESPQEVLEIIEENSDGTIKFDTVFGGTDYKQEYDAFWANNVLVNHESLEEHIATQDLSSIFDELSYQSEYVDKTEMKEFGDGEDLDILLSQYKLIMLSNRVINIGVFQQYYSLYWLQGTSIVFVTDKSADVYDQNYFVRQMEHFGESVTLSINSSHYLKEDFNGFSVYYIGREIW